MAAPIALFAYRRAEHLRRTLAALAANALAAGSDLYIFSDAAKNAEAEAGVSAVRALIARVDGFRTVTVVERPQNLGLAASIIDGVTRLLHEHERVIVVEDDMLTSRHFLQYMNDGLDTYAATERVASIHGYVYPVRRPLPETFFLRGADCWGWATWRRAWRAFEPDGAALLRELKRRGLTRRFDLDGTFGFTAMLEGQIAGRNDSWAIRWHASTFLREMLTLYPGRSLVHNIGNDDSGSHCAATETYDVEVSPTPIAVGGIAVEESATARAAIVEFMRRTQRRPGTVRAMARKLAGLFGR